MLLLLTHMLIAGPFLDDDCVQGALDPLMNTLQPVDVELLVADQVDRAATSLILVVAQGLSCHWVLSLGRSLLLD